MRLSVLGPGHVLLDSRRTLRWLLLALAALLTVATVGCWIRFAFPAPLLVGVLLSLLLLVGAIVALWSRTEVEIDGARVRYTMRRIVGGSEIVERRATVAAVTLRAEIIESAAEDRSPTRHMAYEVALRCTGSLPGTLVLRRSHHEHRARQFAESVCRAADLPLLDSIGEEPEVRAPEALDGPPDTRLAAPRGAVPEGLTIDDTPFGGALATCGLLPKKGRAVTAFVALASLFATGLGGVVTAGEAGGAMHAVTWAALACGEGAVLAVLAWLWLARTSVQVQDGELRAIESVLGVSVRQRRVPVAAIERVRVQSREGKNPHLQPGVAVVSDRGAIVVGQGLDADGRRWLRAWLESKLWPKLPETPPS